jgi:hypothetical protein
MQHYQFRSTRGAGCLIRLSDAPDFPHADGPLPIPGSEHFLPASSEVGFASHCHGLLVGSLCLKVTIYAHRHDRHDHPAGAALRNRSR